MSVKIVITLDQVKPGGKSCGWCVHGFTPGGFLETGRDGELQFETKSKCWAFGRTLEMKDGYPVRLQECIDAEIQD